MKMFHFSIFVSECFLSIFQNIPDGPTFGPTVPETANDEKRNSDLTYGIDDTPPWYLCLFMALQVTHICLYISIYFAFRLSRRRILNSGLRQMLLIKAKAYSTV